MRFFAILSGLVLPICLLSQAPGLSDEVLASINKRIQLEASPSYAIGVISPEGSYYYNFGLTARNGTPVHEHTVYEIGSISKTFTATMLAKAVIDGKMRLDDPVQNYVPADVRIPEYEGKQILLGQLSDHSSSLPRMPDNFTPADPANPYIDYSEAQLFDFLSRCQLTAPVGSRFEYSNLAVGLLGHILTTREGLDFDALLHRDITGPLSMEESATALSPEMRVNLAIGHGDTGMEVSNWDFTTLAGAGGIRSTTHDMLIYLGAQLGLAPTSLSPAIKLTHVERHQLGGAHVGLAWFIQDSPSGKIYSHGGGTGGYRTFAGFCPDTRTGVVVLTNSTTGADDLGLHLLDTSFSLAPVQERLGYVLRDHIGKHGVKNLKKAFDAYQEGNDVADIVLENEINSLGYQFLQNKQVQEALALFKLNLENFPNSANVYDSYGEALAADGNTKESIANYQKSLELNPGNANAIQKLKEMGVTIEEKNHVVSPEILLSYVGVYQLAPGFNIEITSNGKQIFGQATGQGKFELFAKNDTSFYLKLVEARVDFAPDADGTMSLTLFQNGQIIPGKKL